MTDNVAVRAVGLRKTYGTSGNLVHALRGVDIAFTRGELTAIMGPSGSGKSTLMHCAAGLDQPSGGEVFVGDTALSGLTDDALTELRRDRIGFIFQAFNLLPTLSAAENITLPLDLAGHPVEQARLDRIVRAMKLGDRLAHRPSQLSGGQQQRVACARALVTDPDVVFADEPTGALDTETSAELLDFLRRSVDELGQTVVLVTHDATVASYADRVVFLTDGQLVDELLAPDADAVLDRMKTLQEAA